MPITECEIFTLYNDTFKPIYGDLIVTIGKKPPEILEQMENCFAHFAVAGSNRENQSIYQKNIDQAYFHIIRASLDVTKLLWTEYRNNSLKYVEDKELRVFCLNASEGDIFQIQKFAENESLVARRFEVENTGKTPEESIEKWYSAALAYKNLYDQIDFDKVRSYKKHRIKNHIKNHGLGFILGISASTIVSWFWPTAPATINSLIRNIFG